MLGRVVAMDRFRVGKSLGQKEKDVASRLVQVLRKKEYLAAMLVTGSGGPAGLCFTLTVTVWGRTCIMVILIVHP